MPSAPDLHGTGFDQERTFRIDLSPEEFLRERPSLRANVGLVEQKKREGVRDYENRADITIVADLTAKRIGGVIGEIEKYAERFIRDHGISMTEVEHAFQRLVHEGKVKSVEGIDLQADVLPHMINKLIFALRLAIDELLANNAKHGNQGRPLPFGGKYGIENGSDVYVQTWDSGEEGFSRGEVPDPTNVAQLEIPRGRGLLLMEHYASSVRYISDPKSNRVKEVHIAKRIGGFADQSSEQFSTLLDELVAEAYDAVVQEQRKKRREEAEKAAEQEREQAALAVMRQKSLWLEGIESQKGFRGWLARFALRLLRPKNHV